MNKTDKVLLTLALILGAVLIVVLLYAAHLVNLF